MTCLPASVYVMFARSNKELRYIAERLVGGPVAALHPGPSAKYLIRRAFRVHWDGKSNTSTFL
jgi:hypothetical protein